MATVNWPKLAILGHGRAGKDTAGEWIGKHTPLRYVGSTSNVVNPLIAAELGLSEEESWRRRHENRQFWFDWCNRYREGDPSKLIKLSLEKGDIVVGLRANEEVKACREQQLIDLLIWIENPRVPIDPTVKFSASDCDVTIINDGTLEAFYKRLESLCRFAAVPVGFA